MSLKDLHRRIDQLEKRAKTERAGILHIVDCVDLATIERWSTYTTAEREQLRSDIEKGQAARVDAAIGDKTGDTFQLAAIVVRDWLPPEDEIWRLDFDEAEPERSKAEPIATPEPTFAEMRDQYEAENNRRRSQGPLDA